MDWHNPNSVIKGQKQSSAGNEPEDVLRGRFTKWLDIVLYRAKLKYLRKLSQQIETISLDELIDSGFQPEAPDVLSAAEQRGITTFVFEEDQLDVAFHRLPIMGQKILEMLYVDEMKPKEIATKLNCSVQHVYNRRSSSLKTLRRALAKEGKENDK